MMKKERWGFGACRRCREHFRPGDAYYEVPALGRFCPDCMDALAASWRRVEGDAVDLC